MASKRMKGGRLTEHERELFENLNKENKAEINLEVLRQLLGEPDVYIDCLDDHGMTPLQHAAFKNNQELCNLFLSNGADVNCNEHENGYTTLMFAALSGNTEVTRLMLEAGAKTSPKNSVGRTATQMAAFVGQHACVSLINNFFSLDDLAYYTKIQGFEKEPKLQPSLAPALHKLMLFNNLNPVKLSQHIEKTEELLNEAPAMARVLDAICEKMMKGSSEPNDVLSIKMHYLACVMRGCHKWNVEKEKDGVGAFVKFLLRGRETDGFQLGMEKFIRDAIKEFPYHESQLLQEIVRNIASTSPGNDPSAILILTQGINGSRSVETDTTCVACGDIKAMKKCSACKMVVYCSQPCQKLHWFTHKKACKNLTEEYKRIQEAMKYTQEMEAKEREMHKQKEEENNAKNDTATSDAGEPDEENKLPPSSTAQDEEDSNKDLAKPVSAKDIQIENLGPALEANGDGSATAAQTEDAST